MAKAYREGAGWSTRVRVRGESVYLSGFATAAAADKEARRQRQRIEDYGKPEGEGPQKTCVAVAMQRYACERLPFLKGAEQEARRINRYLRAAGQDVVVVTAITPYAVEDTKAKTPKKEKPKMVFFEVSLAEAGAERIIPQGLGAHRAALSRKTSTSDRLRSKLACTTVADVTKAQVQKFVDALRKEVGAAATVHLERALLRTLFYHAADSWNWPAPARNPAVGLKMPTIPDGRDRVFDDQEWARLEVALEECLNDLIAPALLLLRETAMRSSEALETATWGDVNWDQKTLHLRDAKAGARDVPLSPLALETLLALPRGEAHEPILPITYEALKAGWQRACKRADIKNAHLHDLRHTGATRFALGRANGNIFLLQAFTGHKTLSQLLRYVNVKAADVAKIMHEPEPSAAAVTPVVAVAAVNAEVPTPVAAVAVMSEPKPKGPALTVVAKAEAPVSTNVVYADFAKRRAA